ncbi:MAG: c-type cytochrome, partial [Candidatus Eiseniibacteriota bacterium]
PVRIRQHIGSSRMPNFQLDRRESLALTLFLGEQISPGSEKPDFASQESFEAVRSSNPDVTASMGRELFLSLNCLGCHKHASLDTWEEKIAPNLGFEGARVTTEWLMAYLRKPQALRPFGYYPGTGSRHPDFLLTENEVDTLADFLMKQRGGFDYQAHYYDPKAYVPSTNVGEETLVQLLEPAELVRFSMTKAEGLLREKLPCLGCHRLGGDGGMIGPDLSSLTTRLQPDFARQIIRNPEAVVTETIMPLVAMPPKTTDLIEQYLLQQAIPRDSSRYLSLVETQPLLHQSLEGGERLYVKHCAACHGVHGDGDGYNAEYLPVAPIVHSDSAYMSTRPDDDLFDGIYAGGYILNKSQRMPPWGFTLERREIWQLVAYMRQLCRCEGPAWSRDNMRRR